MRFSFLTFLIGSSSSTGFLASVGEGVSDVIGIGSVNVVSTTTTTTIAVPSATAVARTAPSVRMMFNLVQKRNLFTPLLNYRSKETHLKSLFWLSRQDMLSVNHVNEAAARLTGISSYFRRNSKNLYRICDFYPNFNLLKVAIHYAWCVICMRDARNLWIKGCIVNHQQTRVYTLFAIRSFPLTNLACISKKVWMRIFPLVMREVTASRKDRALNFMST